MITNDSPQAEKKRAPPCVFVIFGIAGDLVKRLLYPAICNLGSEGMLDEKFCIVGVSKEPYNNETFREKMKKDINDFISDQAVKDFALSLLPHVYYLSGNFDDSNIYNDLKKKLEELESQKITKNCLFYFAAHPKFMSTIAKELGKAQLLSEQEGAYFRRIVVEKPFGHNLASAKKLNQDLLSVMSENQIFRIDHFLGKETVQNILSFRFSNGLFEPIWSRLYIDNVQITAAECLGVELRGEYYEQAGALRDMIPNHLFQMLSLLTMEPPVSFSSDYIRDEKEKALRTVRTLTPKEVLQRTVRGQYGSGKIDNSERVGYRAEKNVASDSHIETYVAIKLYLDSWRWFNVPFYLRTGKRMKSHTTEIVIQFKSGPSTLFAESENKVLPNLLRLYIQPDEGIALQFNTKTPGPTLKLGQVDMKFKYADYFGVKPKTGYETILYDCMNGDHLLFKKAEMVETGWALVEPILEVWGAIAPTDFPNYGAGTWGPKEADELLEKDGRKWLM